MKLSYKEGKTIVEVDGEQMGVAKAVLKFPKQAKEILTYSKTAKKISEMKITSFTREYSRAWNPYMADDTTTFYVNGKEIAQFRDGNVEAITTPDEKLTPETKAKVEALKAKLGISKIDWVNGIYFANGEPLTKANYDFMQSYLSGAELNAETGKISTQVEPSFDVINLTRMSYIGKPIYSLGKNNTLMIEQYFRYDHYSGYFEDKKVKIYLETKAKENDVLFYKKIDDNSVCPENNGTINKCLEAKGIDLVNAKVGALLNDYTNQKTKETELSL